MANRRLNGVIGQIRKLGAVAGAAGATDAELLARFVETQDEIAFGTLVKRHTSLVFSVCQRVLSHAQDAEDACQATFLVLAQKAASIRKMTSLSSWLHGVAYRVASNVRLERSRRRVRESTPRDMATTEGGGLSWQEVQAILDEELMQLPESLRAPLLLCLLEGKTRDEAAHDLGWSLSTLRGRLERGRKYLQARLVQRGLTLSIALIGVFVVDKATAGALSPAALDATVKAALLVAAGQATTGVISSQVAGLMKGVLSSMLVAKMKFAGLVVLAISILGIGAGLFLHQAVANDQAPAPPMVTSDLDGPTIVVLDQADDKKPEKAKEAKPAGDAKSVRFQMEGVLEEVDAKEGYITVRDMIRSGKMDLTLVKGKDGFNATLKLAKPTILKNLRVLGDAKITDDGKEKKLSDLKAGLAVKVDLEYRRDGLVVVGMQKTASKGLRIIGGLDGGAIEIQIEGSKKKDKNP
ncbi:MAG: sigma-70 family RNA polymerase sigma factor [Gemmataceae bacterium]|nr:sigma-70 family RNA polymerase sigma factor [Gemmataceae bacterium]